MAVPFGRLRPTPCEVPGAARRARGFSEGQLNCAALTPGSEPIPIIGGTGALGAGLARRWARAGAPVVLGSRSAERAVEAAAKVREDVPEADVTGLENAEAAAKGQIVFLTVPFRAQSENLNNLREALRPGQILVDCTVPLAAAVSGKATRSLGVWPGSAAPQAQEMVPEGVTVVSALHTVGAPSLADLDAELGEDILVCGDKKADKARVARLIELIPGLRAVNAGALEMARIVEQLTPLLISVNVRYKVHAGIRLTDLPDADHWA
jgi:8-hydroxy-5-deazaflavin:NADPH oxidoreductase